jgi:hypothetical protein
VCECKKPLFYKGSQSFIGTGRVRQGGCAQILQKVLDAQNLAFFSDRNTADMIGISEFNEGRKVQWDTVLVGKADDYFDKEMTDKVSKKVKSVKECIF